MLSRARLTVSLVATLAAVALALPSGAVAQDSPVLPYRAGDEAVVARNILPPGQGQHLNEAEFAEYQASGAQPERNTDQIAPYEDLVQAAPDLSPDDLDGLFKDASFGIPEDEIDAEYAPRDGVSVLRDTWGVPHVYGSTAEDTMFGVGYVSAEDRLFMMDVLRHLGRGRLSELLGASEANLQADRAQRKLADYTEDELAAMAERAYELDPEVGAVAQTHFDSYVEGINAYINEALVDPSKMPAIYGAIQQVPEPWTATDTVAVTTLIGGDFSPGGGEQLDNARLLVALMDEGYSYEEARTIVTDLRMADDPEAPTTVDREFPFLTDLPAPDPDAVVIPDDPGTALEAASSAAFPEFVDTPVGPMRLRLGEQHSNALLVGSELSEDGRGLAVMGPQVGYFSPQILLEIDMHGPGIHARGAAFPGISLYVLLGRGANYAWSATTANGDHRDVRAVELCDPDGGEPDADATHYLDDGDCVEMYTRTDTWQAKPTVAGIPDPGEDAIVVSMTTERTRHGIVQTRGEVDGVPHAFVLQRESYGKEVDAALTFTTIHDPARIGSIEDLRQAFVDHFSYSFNWFLIHDNDIAYQMVGHYPHLPDGVDPDLPINGDSRWDPGELLAEDGIPHVVNPDKGYITNWNGKHARGFRAADAIYEFGPTQRVMHLDDGVERGREDNGKVDLTELTQAMAIGGTQDLYGDKVLPLFLEVIGDVDDDRLTEAIGLLDDWNSGGAHRRDLDGDGEVDGQAAVALFDAWWPKATAAVFRPVLGDAFDAVPMGITERARPGGSSYFSGWHGQLHKDLRQILGREVDGPLSRTYCGEGDLAACRQDLRDSLDAAIVELEEAFGDDPADWDFDESTQDIAFSDIGLASQRSMHWQNRPTFQQVLTFGDARQPAPAPPAEPPAPEPLPTTGGGAALLGILALGAAFAGRRRGIPGVSSSR